VDKQPYDVEDMEDIEKCVDGIHDNIVCPIFKVSSTNGEGFDRLTRFIYQMKSRLYMNPSIGKVDDPVEFYVQDKFTVNGVGTCVNGVLVSGTVQLGQTLLFGPDNFAIYRPVVIKSIHVYRQSETSVARPLSATFNIKALNNNHPIQKKDIRNGMV
jgi:GTPase